VELAERALKERPTFSIRMHVYLSMPFLFIIVLAIALTTSATTAWVQDEAHQFEVTSRIMSEIEQVRRLEMNFFLHGTNLDDAIDHAVQARRLLGERADRVSDLVGRQAYRTMVKHLDEYERLLEQLALLKTGDAEAAEVKRQVEVKVRRHGRQMLSFAVDLKEREKAKLNRLLSVSRTTQSVLVGVLLLYIIFMTYLLIRRIVMPIRRFMQYTERIAGGDHTPITPVRPYRDEFSALAVAVNKMLRELDRRQEILAESHKLRAIGTLTAGVAHELNNPINNITLTAHVLLEDYEELTAGEQQEMLQEIIQETLRTKKIVASLLDFARQSESHIEPFDLAHVVRETLVLAQNQLNLKGAKVASTITPDLPKIHGDAQQINQVLLNLVLNALDVTDKGGTIEISVDYVEGKAFVVVEVKDHGPGIPAHILPQIFDPFFTTKKKGKGVGLGLSICRGIVQKHDGELTVDTALGQGTTFTVLLPVTTMPLDFNEVVGPRLPAPAG
jgi:signal transduction histidine kinase